jgi:hypothetical protein
MQWPQAIRLAAEILAMAKATGQELPEGVEVPSGGLIGLQSYEPIQEAPPPPLQHAATVRFAAFQFGKTAVIRSTVTDGYGIASDFYMTPAELRDLAVEFSKFADEAERSLPQVQ